MHRLIFSEDMQPSYRVALLVPQIKREEIQRAYFDKYKLDPKDVVVLDLPSADGKKKKLPMTQMREYIAEELQEVFDDLSVEYILCADADFFKAFTKSSKVEAQLGYVLDSQAGSQKILYVPNYAGIFYDPEKVHHKISLGMRALEAALSGQEVILGADIIKFCHYPQGYDEIKLALEDLLKRPETLTCDIEAFSLKHYSAGIGTITFCWNQHEGIAFAVDYIPIPGSTEAPYGRQADNKRVKKLLRWFFCELYKQQRKVMYHAISYDVYVLIYELFMTDTLDYEGLLHGLDIMLTYWDCTKLITYLATNSCAGNKLGLKDQAHEFAGNYGMGESIKDIRNIPLAALLKYNLIDGLSTWYTYNKRHPQMVADEQEDIYYEIFQPAMVDVVQMQLTGMPVDMQRVVEVKAILTKDYQSALSRIYNSPIVQEYNERLRDKLAVKKNAKLKVKQVTAEDFADEFNPNSGPQLQDLLFEVLGLPVLSKTKTGLPETGAEALQVLKNHTKDTETLILLDALVDYKAVEKILGTFIKALEGSYQGKDGWHYLYGNFNLGGTVSGRLSSSEPNLQNLPANGNRYAKLIKSCFVAPPGWLFGGLDFDSLEDRISALTTKDPMKLKVYTDGFDGHCLRAYAYFGDRMPDIDGNCVTSINSIATKYPNERQDSKAPTFALTYQGTASTLVKNCGFSLELALQVEEKYHVLYKVSDDWVASRLDEASKVGYVTVAFGLRIRTPLLYQVVRNDRQTPKAAEAEGRTAGNGMGQSWCLLNSRTGSEVMRKVRKSRYRTTIRISAQIHDCNYFMFRDDIAEIMYLNKHLVKAARWQDHPDIYHDTVKLGGTFFVCFPSWAKEVKIPNEASAETIREIVAKISGG